ncbi:MAG TPA: hypothetical protein VEW69_03390 [Alphaproteobacteria bacterium]|nr:hypothetical protein [Alphaproteobacteria bacterium]
MVLNKTSKILLAVTMAGAILALAGCPQRTTIAEINSDPGKFAGKEVMIAGTVSDAFGALGEGIFQVDDGTGKLWVLSQGFGIPGNGSKTAVTGRVEQGVSFGSRNFGTILRETQKRE